LEPSSKGIEWQNIKNESQNKVIHYKRRKKNERQKQIKKRPAHILFAHLLLITRQVHHGRISKGIRPIVAGRACAFHEILCIATPKETQTEK
jgi:hypothetical protein